MLCSPEYVTPAIARDSHSNVQCTSTPKSLLCKARVIHPSRFLLPPFASIVANSDQDELYKQVIKHHSSSEESKIKRLSPSFFYTHFPWILLLYIFVPNHPENRCVFVALHSIYAVEIAGMWVSFGELADTVMPDGHLSNTCAEIGIRCLSTMCSPKKTIFPWVLSVYLLQHNFSSPFVRDRKSVV